MDTTALVMLLYRYSMNKTLLVFLCQILMNVMMKVIGASKTATTVLVHMHVVATGAIVLLQMESLVLVGTLEDETDLFGRTDLHIYIYIYIYIYINI